MSPCLSLSVSLSLYLSQTPQNTPLSMHLFAPYYSVQDNLGLSGIYACMYVHSNWACCVCFHRHLLIWGLLNRILDWLACGAGHISRFAFLNTVIQYLNSRTNKWNNLIPIECIIATCPSVDDDDDDDRRAAGYGESRGTSSSAAVHTEKLITRIEPSPHAL